MKQTKIVILGAGHVGTHCALSLMFRGLANEIVLIDTDEEKAKRRAKAERILEKIKQKRNL